MVTAAEMIRRLTKTRDLLRVMVAESIEETRDDYAKLNTDQMFEGKLNDGSDIEPEYAESTIRRKQKRGQPTDRVTLKDRGDFYDEYSLVVDDEVVNIGSDVDYQVYIDKKYSQKIWGLDDKRRPQYTFGPFWSVLKIKIEAQSKLQLT
jgi:hypothetical protein